MSALDIDYGTDVERSIDELVAAIDRSPRVALRFPARWLAITLLDDDRDVADSVQGVPGGTDVTAVAAEQRDRLGDVLGPTSLTAIAGARYQWINEVADDVVDRPQEPRPTLTDRIDSVITNRWLGIPIFLAVMWAVFKLTTDVAAVFLDWIDAAVSGPVSRLIAGLLGAIGLGGTWVESLVVDGIVVGVGAVLVFIPILVTLYLALAVLEDTGYMARAAFVMDRVMGGIGLPGKSFLPMLVGFGCTVPAIYATRTLGNERDRILTGLLVPFMSCGARLPVYVLFATAFFPNHAGTVVFLMYLLGIVVAIVLGLILRHTVLRSTGSPPAIMELPPYRMPTVRSIRFHTWSRTKAFLIDAGSIILATSIVVWLLLAIPVGGTGAFGDTDVDDSAFAATANMIAPTLEPLGFGTWEAAGSLMSGFVAKEVVISTMGQVYGVDNGNAAAENVAVLDDLRELGVGFGTAVVDTVRALPAVVGISLGGGDDGPSTTLAGRIRTEFEVSSGGHGALAGLAFMVFVLLYTPCMAAIAAERKELGTRWMWASVVGQTALAWIMALLVFQGGRLLGW
jgi:ferrous iron transport protein B